MNTYWESGRIASRHFWPRHYMEVGGQLHTPSCFTHRERTLGVHGIGGWLGSRAGLDVLMRKTAAGNRVPTRTLSFHWLASLIRQVMLKLLNKRLIIEGSQHIQITPVTVGGKTHHWTLPFRHIPGKISWVRFMPMWIGLRTRSNGYCNSYCKENKQLAAFIKKRSILTTWRTLSSSRNTRHYTQRSVSVNTPQLSRREKWALCTFCKSTRSFTSQNLKPTSIVNLHTRYHKLRAGVTK